LISSENCAAPVLKQYLQKNKYYLGKFSCKYR
jgi:hypothetical protein